MKTEFKLTSNNSSLYTISAQADLPHLPYMATMIISKSVSIMQKAKIYRENLTVKNINDAFERVDMESVIRIVALALACKYARTIKSSVNDQLMAEIGDHEGLQSVLSKFDKFTEFAVEALEEFDEEEKSTLMMGAMYAYCVINGISISTNNCVEIELFDILQSVRPKDEAGRLVDMVGLIVNASSEVRAPGLLH